MAAGGVLFALRESTAADLEDKCPDPNACPESNRDTYDRLKFYSWSAPVATGIGVAGIGVAVTMILLEKKPKQQPTTGFTLVPSAPNAFAGASLTGRF